MSATLIDGKLISKQLKAEVRADVEALVASGGRRPGLAVVIVGDLIPERLEQARSFGCATIDLREDGDLLNYVNEIGINILNRFVGLLLGICRLRCCGRLSRTTTWRPGVRGRCLKHQGCRGRSGSSGRCGGGLRSLVLNGREIGNGHSLLAGAPLRGLSHRLSHRG